MTTQTMTGTSTAAAALTLAGTQAPTQPLPSEALEAKHPEVKEVVETHQVDHLVEDGRQDHLALREEATHMEA
jgi:hypothetical protein